MNKSAQVTVEFILLIGLVSTFVVYLSSQVVEIVVGGKSVQQGAVQLLFQHQIVSKLRTTSESDSDSDGAENE